MADPDVILINEHGRKDEERIKLFQYDIYQKNHLNEQHAGIAIAVKKGISHQIMDDFDEDYLAIRVMTSLGPLVIGTGYQPPRNPHLPIHTILRLFRRQEPVIFAGDLNARHHVFNHSNNNFAGETINNMIRTGSTIHIGPDFQTYITPRATGSPDIVLTNNNFIYNTQISPGPLTTSDHIPVMIKISASPIQIPVPSRYNYRNADWEGLERELTNFTTPELDGQPVDAIDEQLEKWFDAVRRAMDNNIPKIHHRTIPHIRITNEIKLIQQAYNNLHQKARQSGWTPLLRNTAKILQNNLREIMKKNQNDLWDDILRKTENEYKNPETFWRTIKNLMGTDTSRITYLIDPQGNKLVTPEQQTNEFKRHLERIFNISDEENNDFCQATQHDVETFLAETDRHKHHDIISLARLNANDPLLTPITRNTVLGKIRSFKNKKAPGHSKITKQVLMKLPINMLDSLTDIFNAALSAGFFPTKFKHALIKMLLKQGKTPVQTINYRPISLLETAGKVYEKILNDRFRNFLSSHQHHNEQQHSYRKNRGTVSAIALTYECIAASQQERQQCNVVFRDVSKAFDKVWHHGLMYKLCRLNMPRIFTASLCNFLENRTATVQVGNSISAPIQLRAGVPQGSVLSPSLYNHFISDINLLHSTHTAYADDVTQVITYHGPSKEMMRRKTERAINELNNYEHRWKIRTNSNKFKIMHVSKYNPLPIVINNIQLQYTNTATLLGLTLKRNGITQHIKKKRILASCTLRKLKRFKNLSPGVKLHLYKALIIPVLDYPVIPMNIIKPTNWKHLQAIQNKALRWVNGDVPPYETTITALHHHYKLDPLNVRNHRLASRMWDKIRTEFPEQTQEFETREFRSTHAWWPLAYIQENGQEPDPIYGNIRRRNNYDNDDDEDEM